MQAQLNEPILAYERPSPHLHALPTLHAQLLHDKLEINARYELSYQTQADLDRFVVPKVKVLHGNIWDEEDGYGKSGLRCCLGLRTKHYLSLQATDGEIRLASFGSARGRGQCRS